MSSKALAMPDHVSELVTLSMLQAGLEPIRFDEDIRGCELEYENGLLVHALVMCAAKVRLKLFRSPVVLLSIAEIGPALKPLVIHFKIELPFPYERNDVLFSARLGIEIVSSAWALAATLGAGECVSVARRPSR